MGKTQLRHFFSQNSNNSLKHDDNLTLKWPWKHIWRTKIPYKVACFVCLVVKQACLTLDKLQMRGIQLCYLPLMWTEFKNKVIFFALQSDYTTLDIFFAMIGLSWSVSMTTPDMHSSWKRRRDTKIKRRCFMIPGCLWWTIWKKQESKKL